MNTTQEIVINIIADKLNKKKEDITLESEIVKDLAADSLSVVEIMMEVEAKYQNEGIDISDEEAAKIKTVADIIKCIEEKKHKS